MEQMTTICDLVGQVMQKKEEEKRIAKEQATKISISRKFPVYDDDDDEYSIQTQEYLKNFSSANTPDLPIEEPINSLSMGDDHLDTIPATESDEVIKSSVKDPVPIPSECEVISDDDCDLPLNDDSPESHFTTFSNPLFNSNDDFSSDDESLSEEEIQKDEFKYFSNPLYDFDNEIINNEKILPIQKDLDIVIPIPPGIDERCFNAESDLLESLLNCDSPIDSTKIDLNFDEFSLPLPPKIPSSQSFSPIPMEEIDLFLDNSIPSGIDNDDDSKGDILPLEELLDNVLSPLPESDDFTVDVEPVAAMTNDFDRTIPSHLPSVLFFHLSPTPMPLLYLAPPGVKTLFLTLASLLRAGGLHHFSCHHNHNNSNEFLLPSLNIHKNAPLNLRGGHIKKYKGKKAMSSKDAEEVSTKSDSDDETTHVPSSMVESSKKKELKKFDFVTESGEHVHLTKEYISAQKKIEEEPKAEAARHEGEIRKEELIDLLGPDVVNRYYNDKLQYEKYYDKMLNRRAKSRITNCDILTRKDDTSEIIPKFKASDLHLGEWREVVKA
ncbi:hypothetical protein Tco_1447123 [Tanacetum coccineum]